MPKRPCPSYFPQPSRRKSPPNPSFSRSPPNKTTSSTASRRPLPPQETILPPKQEDRTGRSFGGYSKLRTNARGEPLWLSSMALKREEEQLKEEEERKRRMENRRKLKGLRDLETDQTREGVWVVNRQLRIKTEDNVDTVTAEKCGMIKEDTLCHPDRKLLLAGEEIDVRHYEPARGRNDRRRPSHDLYRPNRDEEKNGGNTLRGRRCDGNQDSPQVREKERSRVSRSPPPSRGRYRRGKSRSPPPPPPPPPPPHQQYWGRDFTLQSPEVNCRGRDSPSPSLGKQYRGCSPPLQDEYYQRPRSRWGFLHTAHYQFSSFHPNEKEPIEHMQTPAIPPPHTRTASKDLRLAEELISQLTSQQTLVCSLPSIPPSEVLTPSPLDQQTRLRMPPHQRPPAVWEPVPLSLPYPPPSDVRNIVDERPPESTYLAPSLGSGIETKPLGLPTLYQTSPLPLGAITQERLNANQAAASEYLSHLARIAASGRVSYCLPADTGPVLNKAQDVDEIVSEASRGGIIDGGHRTSVRTLGFGEDIDAEKLWRMQAQ